MTPPRGVLKTGQEGKVCHLLKGLYGLKQAGEFCIKNLPSIRNELGVQTSAVDHSVFYRRSSDEHSIVAVVMVERWELCQELLPAV